MTGVFVVAMLAALLVNIADLVLLLKWQAKHAGDDDDDDDTGGSTDPGDVGSAASAVGAAAAAAAGRLFSQLRLL
jgi:hypothetical protein